MPDRTRLATKLKTRDVLGVEILAPGDWLPSAGGPWTVDADTIDRIVANYDALGDLLAPPVKLGHSDDQLLLQSDGYPAAGWVSNVRKSGTKIVCDFLKMPAKVADIVEAGGYRKCSVEVWKAFTVDGETYNDVLIAVSLLGNEIPAVSGLNDIVALYASKAKIGFTAATRVQLALHPGPGRRKAELGADTSVEDLREAIDSALRDKYGDGINGYDWPWVEETFPEAKYVIATRDGRHWQIPYSIGSDGSVSLGTETEVEQTWRPITPAGAAGETEEEGMAELKRIAAALGLAEGATEDQIVEAATKAATTRKLATQAECEEKGGKWDEAAGSCTMPATEPVADAKLATRVVELERTLARRDAKDAVDSAIRAKKLAPAQREWAETYAEKDPAGFKAYVEKTPEIFAASGGSEGDTEQTDPLEAFKAKVEEIRKADSKLDEREARRRASRQHPELFAAAMGR